MAAGSRQSPVNIETNRAKSDHEALSSKPLRWKYPATVSRKLVNPGYCWRVDTYGEGTCKQHFGPFFLFTNKFYIYIFFLSLIVLHLNETIYCSLFLALQKRILTLHVEVYDCKSHEVYLSTSFSVQKLKNCCSQNFDCRSSQIQYVINLVQRRSEIIQNNFRVLFTTWSRTFYLKLYL